MNSGPVLRVRVHAGLIVIDHALRLAFFDSATPLFPNRADHPAEHSLRVHATPPPDRGHGLQELRRSSPHQRVRSVRVGVQVRPARLGRFPSRPRALPLRVQIPLTLCLPRPFHLPRTLRAARDAQARFQRLVCSRRHREESLPQVSEDRLMQLRIKLQIQALAGLPLPGSSCTAVLAVFTGFRNACHADFSSQQCSRLA